MQNLPRNIKIPSVNTISNFIHSDRFKEGLTWIVPPITPLFRYAIDKKDSFEKTKNNSKLREKKKKLLKRDLIRDVSIYSLGTAFYFGSGWAINKGLKHFTKVSKKNRKVAAFLGALALNVVYVSAIASKLSKKIMQMQKGKESTPEEYLAAQSIREFPEKNSFDKMPNFSSGRDDFLFLSFYNKLNKEKT